MKNDIFGCLQEANSNSRIQLSEIICTIALQDYPENWPDLIDKLLEKINPSDFGTNLTILKTLHYIFKRYRLEERSDDLYREINYTMSKFGPALLQIYVGIESLLQSGTSDKQFLSLVLQNAIYANKIFYSLSFQDIPEFIETNLATFMRILMFLFTFESNLVVTQNEDEPGLLEKLTSSVAKIAIMYAGKYEEDFSQLPQFAQATWTILTGRVSTLPKDDKVACTCICFLASVAHQERHKDIFAPTLEIICEKIILPNMTIRESDLEVFEDEPIEFIKRDTEGSSEVSNRYTAAVTLVRNLMEFFEVQITQILFASVQRSLYEYSSNPTRNWRHKLLATQIFSAIGARGFTEAFGVTRVNSLLNLKEFFVNNVAVDLQAANEGLHPLIKLEAIKFVAMYRNQLDKAELSLSLTALLHHLESKNYIIHTYAALAIEKILSIRRGGESLFSTADISSLVGKLSVTILALIFNHRTLDKMCENYFLIKAFMRVISLAPDTDITSVCAKFQDRLIWLLAEIVKNPMNPLFNHYLFESFAVMIKATAASAPTSTFAQLESQLVPILFGLLQAEQSDLFPYTFQLFALMTECSPQPALPEYSRSLLPALTQPVLWAVPCNTPALIRFAQAVLTKEGPNSSLYASMEALLGIFRLLLSSKVNEQHAFALLSALFSHAPLAVAQQHLRPALMLILTRVQRDKSQRLCTLILLFTSLLIGEDILGPDSAGYFLGVVEGIQPRLYLMLLKSLFIPSISKVIDPLDKKCVVLGMTRFLLCLKPLMGAEKDTWSLAISEVIKMACSSTVLTVIDVAADEVSSSQGAFNRLTAIPKASKYKARELPSAQDILISALRPVINDEFFSSLDETSRVQLLNLLK